jgi:hypothetical protein
MISYSQFAKNILEGMKLDLEGDKIADPDNNNAFFKKSLVTVVGIEVETDDCVRIDFADADSVGFPPDHKLIVTE